MQKRQEMPVRCLPAGRKLRQRRAPDQLQYRRFCQMNPTIFNLQRVNNFVYVVTRCDKTQKYLKKLRNSLFEFSHFAMPLPRDAAEKFNMDAQRHCSGIQHHKKSI